MPIPPPHHRVRALVARALLALPLLAGASRAAAAQTQAAASSDAGAVEGLARRDDGAPIAFALVRLVHAGQSAAGSPAVVQQGITNANGRFHLAGIRGRLPAAARAHIGHAPILSPTLRVEVGRTLQHELRGATQPLQLTAVTVRPDLACLTGEQLAADARRASLWSEAQKGMEVRRAFEMPYRFARVQRQEIETRWRVRRATHRVEVDTIVSEPDSVLARDRRQRDSLQAQGYARGNRIILPDEKHLLDASFLRDHCVETMVAERDGALGLRFRPTGRRREGVDIRGVLWVSADGYQMRRVEFEYLDGNAAYARSWLDYRAVAIGGSPIRLRAAGGGSVEARGPLNAVVKGATARLTVSHIDVRPAGTM
ncbi:MAG: carboxypeptidase-like regulatory domain-containing protein [Gemmatirosa sp.]